MLSLVKHTVCNVKYSTTNRNEYFNKQFPVHFNFNLSVLPAFSLLTLLSLFIFVLTIENQIMLNKILITALTLRLSSIALSQSENVIVGKYRNEERKETIEIYKAKDGLFYGKNESGQLLLHKLKFNAEKKRYEGTLVPLGKNFSMDVIIKEESADSFKMTVTKFFISQTNRLTRIK